MVLAAFAIGIGVPLIHFRRHRRRCLQALVHAHPRHLTMPGATTQSRPRVVHLDRAAHLARLLHVAAQLRGFFHRSQRRYAAAQCGGDAALHPDTGVHLFRRLCGGAGGAGPARRRSGAAHGGAPELSAVVPRVVVARAGALTAMVPAASSSSPPRRCSRRTSSPAVRSRHERCTGGPAGARRWSWCSDSSAWPGAVQLSDAGVAAAHRLRRRDAVLPRRRAGPLLAARQRRGSLPAWSPGSAPRSFSCSPTATRYLV